ncbi:colanic acid/amylovoran biosynthesis glycosyltransferase [Methylophilaceae bacterium]|nr:colanic acid/amylovoran biosynthesis glycosyltransferase [Methylophilaceae bacterium]
MRIAYFINQYPKVSHSFIRREILALERQGFNIQRIALRGWEGDLVDEEDLRERTKTRFVLMDGIRLFFYLIKTLVLRPLRLFSALRLAWKLGCKAERPLPYHLIYLVEACQAYWWMKSFGAQHVHAHFGSNSTEVVLLAHALGGPGYSFTVHGPEEFDKPQLLKLSEKIRYASFVVAISSYGRSQLFRWIAHDQWHKIRIVHCGIEQAFYDVLPIDMPDTGRLICVGRLCEQKGQLLLLEACRELNERGVSFELVLAGDGEMRAEIEQMITQYGLADHVNITGWISSDEVRERVLDARALVLPSFAEGLPVVIMEAMALRRPVISTYVAGIPELVIPGQNGWLVPAGAVTELADAMQELLATPTSELQNMGDAAYVRVRQRHDVDTEASKLAALFREHAG